MATVSSVVRVVLKPGLLIDFSHSKASVSAAKNPAYRTRFARSRLTVCSSSSSSVLPLKGPPRQQEQDPPTGFQSKFPYAFLNGDEEALPSDREEKDVFETSLETISPALQPFRPTATATAPSTATAATSTVTSTTGGGGRRKRSSGFAAQLPWVDASLQHANVLWFKGVYNAEIICREDEEAESIVRRFRRAVIEAGVIGECKRRRYRETKQDRIKRKKKLVARERRKNFTANAAAARADNAWPPARAYWKPVDHNRKKTKPRKSFGRSTPYVAKKEASGEQTYDSDDDFWGHAAEEYTTSGSSG